MLVTAPDGTSTLCERPHSQSDGLALCGVDYGNEPAHAPHPRLRDILSPATPETHRCRSILANLITPFTGDAAHELARLLHREFGSINAVLAAHPSRLRRLLPHHPDVIEQLLNVAGTMSHCLRLKLREPTGQLPGRTLIEFLRHRIGFEPVEVVYALHFAAKGELITDGVVARGTLEQCQLWPNEIARAALDVGAAGVIIAHNHPSGDPTPSGADKGMTRRVDQACATVGIRLTDHIIIGGADFTSFREMRLL
jgi:DNA repair protein RadC